MYPGKQEGTCSRHGWEAALSLRAGSANYWRGTGNWDVLLGPSTRLSGTPLASVSQKEVTLSQEASLPKKDFIPKQSP